MGYICFTVFSKETLFTMRQLACLIALYSAVLLFNFSFSQTPVGDKCIDSSNGYEFRGDPSDQCSSMLVNTKIPGWPELQFSCGEGKGFNQITCLCEDGFSC